MSPTSFFAKSLRFIGIVLMALTGGFTLLGGIGTTCAALAPTNYDSMAALAPFQWLYILFVIVGIALGVMGIRATIMLVKGADKSYRDAMIALIAGVVIGFIHIAMSRSLRGASMPVDAVVYTTVLTLIIFLLFKIPAIWQGVDFAKAKANQNKPAAGASAILLGILTLTIQFTMGATHTWDGVNYADAFNASMMGVGGALLFLGAAMFIPWGAMRQTLSHSGGNVKLAKPTTGRM
jgi:low temperature requirement protein LtrA